MSNVVELFPTEKNIGVLQEINQDHIPKVYWQCKCDVISYYVDGETDTPELICTGCGTRQRW